MHEPGHPGAGGRPPAPARRRRSRRARQGILVVVVVALGAAIALVTASGGPGTPARTTSTTGASLTAQGTGPGYLSAGSPSALPRNILVADRNNHRLIAITPQGRLAWSKRIAGPSDAYLTPDRRSIIVTEHGGFVVVRIGVRSGVISYRYGHSGHPGTADNHLHDPQTAQQLADGELLITDKSNCRILFVIPPAHRPARTLGRTRVCAHDPPTTFSYPDAAFPTAGGGLVVTELTPAWVDLLSKAGTLVAALRVPGLSAPYDANQAAGGVLIATSHARPGAVEEFTATGAVRWRYAPATGPGALALPSLAQVLPGGDVLVCDSGNDRIVVIDPRSNRIVWQYGHTAVAGSAPGYLHTPDSAILAP